MLSAQAALGPRGFRALVDRLARRFIRGYVIIIVISWSCIPLLALLLNKIDIVDTPRRLWGETGWICMIANVLVLGPVVCYAIHCKVKKKPFRWVEHPARKIVLCRLVFDNLFALSLIISSFNLPEHTIKPGCWDTLPEDPTTCAPPCTHTDCFGRYVATCGWTGFMAQAGIAGSVGYFGVLCLDLSLAVFDSFKDERLVWWYHLIPLGWVGYSWAFKAVQSNLYGLSAGQFCWVQMANLHGFNPNLWIMTYIPSIIIIVASFYALWYAHYCKTSFPNWHKDYAAFNMHWRCITVFTSSWLPIIVMWGWLYIASDQDLTDLLGWLASAFAAKSVVEMAMWWILMRPPPPPPDRTALPPKDQYYSDFLERQRHFIAKRVQALELPPSYSDLPRDLGERTMYFEDIFIDSFWYLYSQLRERDDAATARGDPPQRGSTAADNYILLRDPVWHQLMVIWQQQRELERTPPLQADRAGVADGVTRAFIHDQTVPVGSGYLGNMRRDYITAVELALYHGAIRLPVARGFITPGSAKGSSFQPVPGFTSASFNDYANIIFSEIHHLCGIDNEEYAKSVSKLRIIGHAGGTSVAMLITHDRRYLVKQITVKEKELLMGMAEDYFRHLQQNVDTLLAVILGFHAIRMHRISKSIYFIVMANAEFLPVYRALRVRQESAEPYDPTQPHPPPTPAPTPGVHPDRLERFGSKDVKAQSPEVPKVLLKFDLKGSWISRANRELAVEHILADAANAVRRGVPTGKDMDFERAMASGTLNIDIDDRYTSWQRAIKADALFLMEQGITDYSLLLLVYGGSVPPECCIIDYLQAYDLQKRGEVLLKTIQYRACCVLPGFSAAGPRVYASRFVNNVCRLLQGRTHQTRLPVDQDDGVLTVHLTDYGTLPDAEEHL